MGMQGFDKDDSSAPMAEINTTPLVDVMLVLMVIFLVTAPILTQAVELKLPNEIAREIEDKAPINLSLSRDGDYYWAEEKIAIETLEQNLKEAALKNKAQAIHLQVDKEVPYGQVVKILALCQKYELNNIGFVTQPDSSGQQLPTDSE